MYGSFNDIKIKGIATAVPSTIENNMIYANIIGERRAKRQIKLTGVGQRHISPIEQFPSDLCYSAACRIIDHLNWNKSDIKVLIFITQRPDYKLPSTAFMLQDRLGLSRDCFCYDINVGCSSFNVGLQTVGALLQSCQIHDKALLLVGDTCSTIKSAERTYKDDEIAHDMLFGAEGSAIAVEKVEHNDLYFVNMSDGSGYTAIINEFGESCNMDGEEVFQFAVNEIPNTIAEFKERFGLSDSDIDYYIFHQAQKLILDNIIDMCGIDEKQELRSLSEYGNTSGGSVPLSLCYNIDKIKKQEGIKLLFCGFGVGLSWGCVYTEIETSGILPVFETDDHRRDPRSDIRNLNKENILVIGGEEDICECIVSHNKKRGADLYIATKDIAKMNAFANRFIEAPKVLAYEDTVESMNSIFDALDDGSVEVDGILWLTMPQQLLLEEQLKRIEQYTNSYKRILIIQSFSDEQERGKNETKAQNLFSILGENNKLRINVVLYNSATVDNVALTGNGQAWIEEFIGKNCPDEMAKISYIAHIEAFLLSEEGKFINKTVIYVD